MLFTLCSELTAEVEKRNVQVPLGGEAVSHTCVMHLLKDRRHPLRCGTGADAVGKLCRGGVKGKQSVAAGIGSRCDTVRSIFQS